MDDFLVYYNEIYKYLMKLAKDNTLARDLTQETFYKAFKHQNKIYENSNVKAWLYAIARNCYFNHIRYEKHLILIDEDMNLSKLVDNSVDNVDNLLDIEQKSAKLRRIVHNLSTDHKEVFFWKVYGELTFKQIAELFGKNEGWVMSVYYRTKRKIMKEIEIKT